MDDSKIIALLQNHPRQAVAEILHKYGGTLLGLIFKIVGSKQIAEEILQDTVVKAWKNADKYDPDKGRLFTWLLHIARNTAIDRVRTLKFQRNKASKQLEDSVSNNIAYSEEMQINDVGLHQQIDKLDEKYRQIIDLIYLQGYTQQEVTDSLDIPLGTVKSRVRIAIRELRKILSHSSILFLVNLIIDLTVY